MMIDLNSDMGESYGGWCLGCDELLVQHITSANLACGFHASDPMVMEKTAALCAKNGVAVGAHPGFPDLRGFGRRRIDASAEEIRGDVIYQLGAMRAMAQVAGVKLQHVKPHGAMYNAMVADPKVARAVCQAVADYDSGLIMLCLAGPAGDHIRAIGAELGIVVASEAFADRAYTPEGRLAPRTMADSVLHDPEVVAARCLKMATEHKVVATDGTEITLEAQTICVHGDTPSAVELAARIAQTLKDNGVKLRPLAQVMGL